MKRLLSDVRKARDLVRHDSKKKKKVRIEDLKILFPYIVKCKGGLLSGFFLMLLVSFLSIPAPLGMKYIIDTVIPQKSYNLLFIIIAALIILYLIKLIVSFITSYIFNILSQEVLLRIKTDLFTKILRLPISFFDNNPTGYIMSRIGEVGSLGIFFSNTFTRIVISMFEFIFFMGIMIHLNWRLTSISFAILPFFYFLTKNYSNGIRSASWDVMEKGARISEEFKETISGVDTVKLFTAEKRESQKIGHGLSDFMKSSVIQNIIHSISSELLAFLGLIGGLIVLWFSALEIIQGDFSIGGYIAFSAYLAKLYGPTQILASTSITLQPARTALSRVSELFKMTDENENDRRIFSIEKLRGKIEFSDVSFTYKEGGKKVLKNITFKINPKENVIISGPNGSGKSTIIKIILGLYKVNKGIVLIDDLDVDLINLKSLRERISVVSQNIFLFNDTIKNNIKYSRPEADDSEILRASKLSGAYDFIIGLNKGFDTYIGEIGKKLSEGEKQKIAIARAILKDSDIIIFDEATSNLDKESLSVVKRLIEEEFKSKSVIIITHRLTGLEKYCKAIRLKKRQKNYY